MDRLFSEYENMKQLKRGLTDSLRISSGVAPVDVAFCGDVFLSLVDKWFETIRWKEERDSLLLWANLRFFIKEERVEGADFEDFLEGDTDHVKASKLILDYLEDKAVVVAELASLILQARKNS